MKVLVVEDDAALVAALVRGLRGAGFGVDTAGDAAQAREMMAVSAYDLVVLDLGLPGIDGLTLLRSIRGEGSRSPSWCSRRAARSSIAWPGSMPERMTTC